MEKYNKDITAVIPVREGSTRLKNKNVAPFAGTNLLINKINIYTLIIYFIYSEFYFKYIYMFVINNFNYRQYLFFKMFLEMLNPHVYYFLHRQSFMPRFLNKRRVKRRVLRQLM